MCLLSKLLEAVRHILVGQMFSVLIGLFLATVNALPGNYGAADGLPTSVYSPPSTYKIPRVLYARTLLTSNNTLLATWENYGPEPPYFPIYQSSDGGRSWHEIGRVHDQVNGWGLRYQPFLYELPVDYGTFPKGTLLLAGNSIPEDLSITQIDLYASPDQG